MVYFLGMAVSLGVFLRVNDTRSVQFLVPMGAVICAGPLCREPIRAIRVKYH
jgi:hypothetical protein